MPSDLNGKSVVITGGMGDLGSATAQLLGDHGAVVLAADLITASDGERSFAVDVRQRSSVDDLFSRVKRTHWVPDIVICNAGVVHNSPFLEMDEAGWDETLAVNLTGSFHVAQAAARQMVAAGVKGKIVFIGSWVQDVPWPEGTSYCTSKAGLKMLALCMAAELAPYGIRVNVVAPGIVDAGLSRRMLRSDPGYRERASRAIPLGDLQTAEQVAEAVLWVCLPAGDYMTGATLLVDGGCSLRVPT